MEASLNEPGRPGDSPRPSRQAAAFELFELVRSRAVADQASAMAALELADRAPSDGGRRLAAHVIEHAVDSAYRVDDSGER